MRQAHTGVYVSQLAPGNSDYTACHPRKIATCILHVVPITTHTRVRRKSIGKRNKEEKKRGERKGKERKEKKRKESEEGKTRRDKKRQDKKKQGKKKRKNAIPADPINGN